MKYWALILVIATSPLWAADPDSPAPMPTSGYRSAFDDYRPLADQAPQDWRQANDQMGRLRGHMGHLDTESPRPGEAHRQPEAGNETEPDERR